MGSIHDPKSAWKWLRYLKSIHSVPKNWCFWTVVLEKTAESPLDCKEIQPVHPTGDQFWVFIGRTHVKAEIPILWPPDAKNWLIWKDPDARKDWRQEEKGMTEDEMVGWYHWLNGRESEQAPGDDEGQGSVVCCSPWGHKDQTWLKDWTTTTNRACSLNYYTLVLLFIIENWLVVIKPHLHYWQWRNGFLMTKYCMVFLPVLQSILSLHYCCCCCVAKPCLTLLQSHRL